jgi:hypothetical protein
MPEQEKWGPEDASHGVPGRDKPAVSEPEPEPEPEPELARDQEQAAGGETGIQNIVRQQQDPELDDTSGAHP